MAFRIGDVVMCDGVRGVITGFQIDNGAIVVDPTNVIHLWETKILKTIQDVPYESRTDAHVCSIMDSIMCECVADLTPNDRREMKNRILKTVDIFVACKVCSADCKDSILGKYGYCSRHCLKDSSD